MKPSAETMKPDPEPCSTCGRRRRFGKKSWNPGGSRWVLSLRSTCWERMNTTAGFTCSATATKASDQSLAALRPGAASGAASGEGTSTGSAAPLRFGRLSVDANARPKMKAIATRVPNFNQSRVRTGIAVSSVLRVLLLLVVVHDLVVGIDHVVLLLRGAGLGAAGRRLPARGTRAALRRVQRRTSGGVRL